MATKLYLRSEVSDINPTGDDERLAALTAGSGLTTSSTNTVGGPVGLASLQATISAGGAKLLWISKPLNAVTISGTVTANYWVAESGMNANAACECGITRLDNSGVQISTIADFESGAEMAITTRAAQNFTATPTSTALSAGDRLGLFVFFNDGGGTMASGFTISLGFSGATGAADGDTWVQFTEAITEQAAGSTYTKAGYGVEHG